MRVYKLAFGASAVGVRFRSPVDWSRRPALQRLLPTNAKLETSNKYNRRMATRIPQQESPEISIPIDERDPTATTTPDVSAGSNRGAATPRGPEHTLMPRSTAFADVQSEVEFCAPELLPLWLRYGKQISQELVANLKSGGTLARVKLAQRLDRASLTGACKKAMLGQPESAARALEGLLSLQLKLSYLSAMTPTALNDYTHSQDAGNIERSTEAALLKRLSADFAFPCRDDPSLVLPLLTEHLQLTLSEENPQAWEAVSSFFKWAQPWAVRTECLLAEGCDDRITIPYASGKTTNKYHCSPVPTPEVVSRSSCTSNSVSRRSFDSADAARQDMLLNWALKPEGGDKGGFSQRVTDIRQRLLSVLELDEETAEVFLTPSGSDAELLPMALAMVRARRLGHKGGDIPAVVSVVVAAGEVGSGTALASGGQHFSKLTPRGAPGFPHHQIEGTSPGDVKVVQIKCRSKTGAFLACDNPVISAVEEALNECATSVAVVHCVIGSKTGSCSPSIDTLLKMSQQHGERLVVVVDACQLRSDTRNIVDYAGLGFLTLITGSKFYCGPPFSGAVLFPPAALRELQTGFEELPSGFDDYFTRHEVNPRYSVLCSQLAEWENRGLLLRWASALTHMEAVKSIPKAKLETFVRRWVADVRDDVRNRWPYLGLLPDQGGVPPCRVLGGINTIVALMVRVPLSYAGPDGNPEDALSYDNLRLFHRLLTEDISKLLPRDLALEERALARYRVLFGQPVKLGGASYGIIRIALGADMLIETFCRGSPPKAREMDATEESSALSRLLAQDRLAVDKCCLMARHWQFLREMATGTAAVGPAQTKEAAASVEMLATSIKTMGKDELIVLETAMTTRRRELE